MGSSTYEGMPDGMSATQEDSLRDDGLLFEEPDSAYVVSCGIDGDWPNGRGVSGQRSLFVRCLVLVWSEVRLLL